MAKVVKLFRNPDSAEKAVSQLKSKGFEGEVAVVLHPTEQNKKLASRLPNPTLSAVGSAGEIVSTGPVSAPLKDAKEDLAAVLTKELGIPPEQGKYYESALQIGGVLVAAYTDDSKAAKARQTLRSVEALPQEVPVAAKSPGFIKASRMVDTNPVDAPMSGDFRRY